MLQEDISVQPASCNDANCNKLDMFAN